MKKQKVIPQTLQIKSGVGGNPRSRILIGTPTLGTIRMEWALSRFGAVIPCNWSSASIPIGMGNVVPLHYLVADGQNLIVQHALEQNFEWVLLWEDDVMAPLEVFLKFNEYMKKCTIPIVSGLYFTKGNYSEPIVYRGNGHSCFDDFKMGEKVWVDGVPTGMLLIHTSILRLMWNESKEYVTVGGLKTRMVFKTPVDVFYDPQSFTPTGSGATSDLNWCGRVIREKVLERAGWSEIGKKKYPFLCDTTIMCPHIDLNTGIQYPIVLPEKWIKQLKDEMISKVKDSIRRQKNPKYNAEKIMV